jgi:orotate phosphoribosyltransferase
MTMKRRLAELLLEKSYIEGEVILTSGKKSDYYFDCKQTALHPEGAYLLGNLFLDMLPADIVGVGGMTLGAAPRGTAVTVVSQTRGRPLPGFIVRKNPKGHGTNQYLEGMANFRPGDRVALLEDVVTTGGTLVKVIDRVTDAGLVVAGVYCVLDREEGGAATLAGRGFGLNAIFTRGDLLAAGSGPRKAG